MQFTGQIIEYFAKWTKLKIRIHHAEPREGFYFYEREVWWASLGANIGFEQDGKNEMYERPVLILRKFNKDVFWALPLTSKQKKGRYYFETEYDGEKFNIILSQLRLLSSKRLIRKIRTIPEEEFAEIRKRVKALL